MDFVDRQKRAQAALAKARLDSLLVTHLPNVRYLCGFTGSAGALLVTASNCIFFTDGRYTAQSQAEVQGARIIVRKKSPLSAAAEWVYANPRRTGRRIGIESEALSVAAHRRLRDVLGHDFRIQPGAKLVEQLRTVKGREEIEHLRQAARLGSQLFERALKVLKEGVTEAQVAAEMEYKARAAGADSMAFPTIIASGERSALPHGRATAAPIPGEGFVVCDFGVILHGYCSDQTRTVYVGRPSRAAQQVYDAVKGAQQLALEAVRPGQSVGLVDRAARTFLKKKGLGAFFTHSTGHGVGLEIHEAPRVAKGENEVLCPGMVITIEPGIYVPGKWGIRIEDTVVVTEQGCEILTLTSKELIAI